MAGDSETNRALDYFPFSIRYGVQGGLPTTVISPSASVRPELGPAYSRIRPAFRLAVQRRLTNLLIGCLALLIAALAVVLVANGNDMLILVFASFVLLGLLLQVI